MMVDEPVEVAVKSNPEILAVRLEKDTHLDTSKKRMHGFDAESCGNPGTNQDFERTTWTINHKKDFF